MAATTSEMLRRNVITATVVVALPVIAALLMIGVLIWRAHPMAWGYGFAALVIALIVQYPYLKACDRYIFK